MLDNYLDGVIEQDIYEETDMKLKIDLSNAKAKLEFSKQQVDKNSSLQKRIADFKKALSDNEVLEEFDRGIFESILKKLLLEELTITEKKIPIKLLLYIKQDLKMK